MSETRKLAAILVADVVGYSRLAGADEHRTPIRASLLNLRHLTPPLQRPIVGEGHKPKYFYRSRACVEL
jgi:hypothetical protein